MSNVYSFSLNTVRHFQLPHALDKWLNSIKFEELRMLLLIHSECEGKSVTEIELSTDTICQKTAINRGNIAKVRNALIDYGLLAVREQNRKYTYLIPDPATGIPIPDRKTIGKIDFSSVTSETLTNYALFVLTGSFKVNEGVQGKCPLHNDGTASLFIRTEDGEHEKDQKGLWFCRGCKEAGNIYKLAKMAADANSENVSPEKVFKTVNKLLRKFDPAYAKKLKDRASNDIVFSFVDGDGVELYQEVRRFGLKKNTVVRHMGPNGRYENGMGSARNVLFNLPDVTKADVVFLTEGPKDAVNLNKHGLKDDGGKKVAVTTNLSGSGHFKESHADTLIGKRCILLEDNDDSGVAHMRDVRAKLDARGIKHKTLDLPGLRPGQDVSDFLDTHHVSQLVRLEGGVWLDSSDLPVEI